MSALVINPAVDNKCQHPACTCSAPAGEKYCSPACEESARQGETTECDCNHPACQLAA